MSLNERISKVIEYSHLTPSEFADETEVQRSSISHITSGRNKPSLEFIIKIKSRFPEIMWEWLITGEGEMIEPERPASPDPVKNEIKKEAEKPAAIPLPDLYAMMSDEDDLVADEHEADPYNGDVPESSVADKPQSHRQINDSQRLHGSKEDLLAQAIDNQSGKIKRIVFFYENGKFESFEP